MKKIFAALLVLLLVSCDAGQEQIKPTKDDKEFSVVLNVIPDNQIVQTCTNLGVKYEANGCNAFNTATKVCTIYVMKARYVNDTDRLSIIGHELWHCRYGAYHE